MTALRRLFANPVALKDLLVFANTASGGGAIRPVLAAIGVGAPLLVYAWCVLSFPGPWRFAGRPVFLAVAGLLALFNFSVAVPAATSFALERDRETLDGLVVSPLTPWQLVLGKLTAALAIGATTKTALLPALAVAFALGGADLALVPAYLLVLLAADVSFASFALLVGARRLDAPMRVGWLRTQTSQAQMALQSALGVSVIGSIVPVYALLVLVPLALQAGVALPRLLDTLAPLGALHPLATLALWGDAVVLGVRLPVWTLAVALHLTLALPMLADAAEAQRSEGSAPGRAPRLLFLAPAALVLVLGLSVARGASPLGRVLIGTLLPLALVLGAVLRTAFVAGTPHRAVTRAEVLRGLAPHRALESAPERAPGYGLLLWLLCAPAILWAGGGGLAAALTAIGLLVSTLGLASLGTRAVARGQQEDDAAFREAVARSVAGDEVAEPSERDAAERRRLQRSRRGRLFLRLGLISLVVPLLAAAGISLSTSSLPALGALRPALEALLTLGLALNPGACLLPVLTDPAACGTPALRDLLLGLGVRPGLAFALHVAVYAIGAVAAAATLPKPLDLEAVLAERQGAAGEPPSEG